LSLPSVWFEIHIVTPNFNVYGVSLPGLPGVIIGFNEHIAWGITNTGYDVLDWYQITWTDSTQSKYYLDSTEVPVVNRVEEIHVKGGKTVLDTVSYTHWGPVQTVGPHAGLAMRWLAHAVPDNHEAGVFLRLNKATSHDAFKAALAGFQTPAQNFVYADKEGNIALQIAGKMPLRHDHNGRFVQDGSYTRNGWTGRIPFEHNPSVLNPPRGFVSSANQETTDTTYPYTYLGLFEDFRGRILNRYLSTMQNATVLEMQALENDNVSLKAEELLPLLIAAVPDSGGEQSAILTMMRNWEYNYRTDASAPVFFELWYDAFNAALWDDFIGARDSLYIRLPHAWRTNLLTTSEPDSPEFDIDSTVQVENFQNLAVNSFQSALKSYQQIDNAGRTWGAFRKTTIRHMANIPAFSQEISANGHGDALNATTSTHGPSWRMIVHLSDPIEAHVVYPGGQSGNPGSAHYADMISTWQEGKYYQVQFAKTPEELKGGRVIQMKPKQK
jgi:penicillin amidase